jgi:hypothetical protein
MSQHSSKKYDDDYASKKKKLHPRPEDDESTLQLIHKSQKKLVSGTKSISKSKLSTQKKCEVTFSEGVEEIKDSQQDKENNKSLTSTPYKAKSPSKTSLKSVKEHIKTPFSKIKDNSQEMSNTPVDARSKTNSVSKPTNQPNFNTEIIKDSESKNSNTVTPNKTIKKVEFSTNSKLRSRTKSPLVKIKEEKTEHQHDDENLLNGHVESEKKAILNENVDKIVKEEIPAVIEDVKGEVKEHPSVQDVKEEIPEPVVKDDVQDVDKNEEVVVVDAASSGEVLKDEENKKGLHEEDNHDNPIEKENVEESGRTSNRDSNIESAEKNDNSVPAEEN